MKATLSEDSATVDLVGNGWSTTFPVSDLPQQIAFYRGLRDRAGGRYAQFYAATVSNLEAVEWAVNFRLDPGPDDFEADFFADAVRKAPLGGLEMTLEQVAILALLDLVVVLEGELRALRQRIAALEAGSGNGLRPSPPLIA